MTSADAQKVKTLQTPDGVTIAYRRREGKGSPEAPGLFWLSGFKSDMEGNKASYVDGFAAEQGLRAVRFDYRGHGRSGGAFEEGTLSQWLEDALLVFDQVTTGPQVLVGSSMGGWLALLLAGLRPERVAGLTLIAPAPDFTETMWKGFSEDERAVLERGEVLLRPSAYDDEPYPITPQLIEDGRKHLLLQAPIDVRVPVRLVHGQADPDVRWQLSLEIAELLTGSDVEVTLLKGGDHRLSDAAGLRALRQALQSFFP